MHVLFWIVLCVDRSHFKSLALRLVPKSTYVKRQKSSGGGYKLSEYACYIYFDSESSSKGGELSIFQSRLGVFRGFPYSITEHNTIWECVRYIEK